MSSPARPRGNPEVEVTLLIKRKPWTHFAVHWTQFSLKETQDTFLVTLDTILNKSNLDTLFITRNSWTGFSLQRIHGDIFHFKETLDNFSLQIYPRHIYNYNGSMEAFIFTRKFWTPPITWELDTILI
jgi:hypothetical protein